MKATRANFMLTIFILVPIFLLSSNVFAFQNEPDNFRSIVWGTNVKKLTNMQLMEDGGDTKYYTRKNDKMKIGDAGLKKIGYAFYKNRFTGVIIMFSSKSNFLKIKNTFFHVYGKGHQPNQFLEEYVWRGSTLVIYLKYNEIAKSGQVAYRYMPLFEEEQKDEKEASMTGADDL